MLCCLTTGLGFDDDGVDDGEGLEGEDLRRREVWEEFCDWNWPCLVDGDALD